MGSFNYDEMEELYTRSILSAKKKSKKKVKNKTNETKIMMISIVVATILVFMFFNFLGNKKPEILINRDLIDEVIYEKQKNKGVLEENKKDINEILKTESETEKIVEPHYVIQILASKDINSVDKEVKRIFQKGEQVYRIKEGKSFFKIIIDKKFETRDEAEKYALNLKERKIVKSYWVRFIPGKE